MKILNLRRYARVWLKLTSYSFLTALTSRFSFTLFLIGKILRFALFFTFLILIVSKTRILAGFNLYQVAFFVLTFNLIDTGVQLLFREVYRFRPLIISGNFDLVLVKPFNALFRVLLGGADVIDLFLFIPFLGASLYLMGKIGELSFLGIILYFLLVVNAFLIATALHILVLAIGVLTTEIDNTIMLYRDITRMGMVPVDIYRQPLRGFLTFAIPVGIMMTFPVKALMGLLTTQAVIISFLIGGLLFYASLLLWRFALKNYTSASS